MDDDELPNSSVAVHVTMVSPSGNTSGASLIMIGLSSTKSEALALPISIIFSKDVASKTVSYTHLTLPTILLV